MALDFHLLPECEGMEHNCYHDNCILNVLGQFLC